MWRRIVDQTRTTGDATAVSGALNVLLKVIVCIAGGTLGWMLAQVK